MCRRRTTLREGTVVALRPRLTIALEVADSLDELSVSKVGSKVARSRIIPGEILLNPDDIVGPPSLFVD